ncbi:MAG TPA: ABC transporter permease [Ktedonobacterales bacterium]|nr:ABC transporter permease [Ktedonobacterales bacterium]
MRIEETPDNFQALDTVGAVGHEPATPEGVAAMGGPELEPGGVSQAELDRRAERETREVTTEGQSLSPLQASLRRLGRDKRAMFFLAVALFIIVFSYVFPLIYTRTGPTIMGGVAGNTPLTPHDYHNYVSNDLSRPDGFMSTIHPLGTDALGRDILARIMAGVNVSIEVALLVEVMDIGLGVTIGTLAGYYGGWLATFLDRFTDLMFAFPGLLFAILAAATLGPAFQQRLGLPGRLILVSIALGISVWPFMARLVRGQTLQLREQQFIEAARTVGSSNGRIIMQHIVPNLFNIVIVAAALDVVNTIVSEAIISLLGLGVQTPGSSLGLMINDAVSQIALNPWEVIWPTTVLAILVLAFSFLGDGVQDAFNPRTKD